MIQVVIDTNVIVAAMRSKYGQSNRLLRHLSDPRWQINISAALIFEYEEVLAKQAAAGAFSLRIAEILVDRFCAIGHWNAIYFRWRPTLTDDDDHFLVELAFRCHCKYLITFNQRDLSPARDLGIQVVTPREFLVIMGL